MNMDDHQSEPGADDATLFGPAAPGEEAGDGTIDLTDPMIPPDGTAPSAEDEAAYLPRLVNDAARYTGFLRLGSGGSGLVRSCRDPHLGRVVAIKTLHPHFSTSPFHRSRFVQEARVMAQLEHPNVVPVHELGTDENDASVYFTMKRVQGATLLQVLQALKEGNGDFAEEFRPARLLDVFIQICQAVAFAHSKGVLHRDLKPDNILLGSFGEVLVMDWGLAKVKDGEATGIRPHGPDLAGQGGENTLPGTISGTPLNMAPEQAMGDVAAVDERTDVFSLGSLLYHMLTLERPFGGKDVPEILHNVIHQPAVPPRQRTPERNIPRELEAICMKALAKKREDRFQTLAGMIDDLQRYREGRPVACCPDAIPRRIWKWCRRNPVISTAVATGIAVLILGPGTARLSSFLEYRRLMNEGDRRVEEGITFMAIPTAALEGLEKIQEANRFKILSEKERQHLQLLETWVDRTTDHFEDAALFYLLATSEEVNPRRRDAMIVIHKSRIAFARRAGQYGEVERLLRLPRDYLGNGFSGAKAEDRAFLLDAERYARGEGSLKLTTIPPGAKATLFELQPNGQGSLARTNRTELGTTPVEKRTLPKGSYVVSLVSGDKPEVVFPVWIEHAEDEVAEVALPQDVPDGMVYVPAGPFYAGGEAARFHRRHRRDLEGYFIGATEATFGDYLEFWRDMGEDGGRRSRENMARVRFLDDDRTFHDAWDETGHLAEGFEPGHPVVGVTQQASQRYCAWKTRQQGRTCRLPSAYEWEKAARGVDARAFVWGNATNSSFALTLESGRAAAGRVPFVEAGSFPVDRSVYGAFDLGGNVREWTSSAFGPEPGRFFEVKGASASTPLRFLFCAYSSDTPVVPTDIGFRFVMPFDPARDGVAEAKP